MVRFARSVSLSAALLCGSAGAADIVVSPGNETLSAAITAAMPGDTLILQDGTFTGAGTLTVDKALTLRAASASAIPFVSQIVSLQDETVLQGITFQTSVTIAFDGDHGFYENRFLGGVSDTVSPSTASVVAVGNEFQSALFLQGFDRLVIAGNRFTGARTIFDAADTFFIGNEVSGTVSDSSPILGLLGLRNRVWANRFLIDLETTFATSLIEVNSSVDTATVKNNLFKLTSIANTRNRWSFIDVFLAVVTVEIENNVFDHGGFSPATMTDTGVIDTNSRVVVRSNIFLNTTLPNLTSTSGTDQFTNNLCFNAFESCGSGDGNQDGDPLFVDFVDYQLDTGSPAIDAGPVNGLLLDVDGSTIDLGLYGGSFAIDQFDVQRQMGRVEPYVYPLFDATRGLDGLGGLGIRTVGVARLR